MAKKALIAGAGPAGLTCAIYLSRAGWDVSVLKNEEEGTSSLAEASVIENFPGFPDEISGEELLSRMERQAENCGVVLLPQGVSKIDTTRKVVVDTDGMTRRYDAVVIATGRRPKRMRFLGDDLVSQHTCSVCDGALFKGREVVVIGGGDTAFSEANYLSDICSKVTMLIRRTVPRVTNAVVMERVKSATNVEILWGAVLERVSKADSGRFLADIASCDGGSLVRQVEFDGLFTCIGQDRVEIPVCGNGEVYCCGDCREGETQFQAVIAAASGARVALEIISKENP